MADAAGTASDSASQLRDGGRSLAGNLVYCCLHMFEELIQSETGDEAPRGNTDDDLVRRFSQLRQGRTDAPAPHSEGPGNADNQLRIQAQRFISWSEQLGALQGALDDIIQNSDSLRETLLTLLCTLGETVAGLGRQSINENLHVPEASNGLIGACDWFGRLRAQALEVIKKNGDTISNTGHIMDSDLSTQVPLSKSSKDPFGDLRLHNDLLFDLIPSLRYTDQAKSSPRPPASQLKAPRIVLPSIPEHLSFIAKFDSLSPNFAVQMPSMSKHGWWLPPTKRNAYAAGESYTFCWTGGKMTQMADDSPIGGIKFKNLEKYAAATIFTQRPDTSHLLTVGFDARETSIRSRGEGWETLSFNYGRINNSAYTYSALTTRGNYRQISAPGPRSQIPQLLPDIYDYHPEWDANGRLIPSPRIHAGLVGHLSLLLALPVFSAPRTALTVVLRQCLRPGVWRAHQFRPPAGHEKFRGAVVTVYLDPTNPKWSTEENLDRLQNGEFGPFYGP